MEADDPILVARNTVFFKTVEMALHEGMKNKSYGYVTAWGRLYMKPVYLKRLLSENKITKLKSRALNICSFKYSSSIYVKEFSFLKSFCSMNT